MNARLQLYQDLRADHEFKQLMLDNIAESILDLCGENKITAFKYADKILDRVCYDRLYVDLFDEDTQ